MTAHTLRPIIYYITAHGYGHGVRSCDILRALHHHAPDRPLIVVSDLPDSFLRNRLSGIPLILRRGSFDVGMIQQDSVRVDLPATLTATEALLADWPRLLAQETAWLTEQQAALVVCDIPALPLQAAAQAGIPSIAIGNFAWNWIYAEFAATEPRWQPVIDAFEHAYRQADILLRLPFAEPMSIFPRQIDVPVVARPGTARRDDLIAHTGAPPDRTWVLLSFSTLDWDDAALARLAALHDYAFLTVRPLAWEHEHIYPVDRTVVPYSDVIASADIVLTKPGFGVVSECVVNRKPMVYVDRTDFREYPILEAAVQRYLPAQHLAAADLYAGRLGEALDAIRQQPWPQEQPPLDGADAVARLILDRCADAN
jgi:hypothetical protein